MNPLKVMTSPPGSRHVSADQFCTRRPLRRRTRPTSCPVLRCAYRSSATGPPGAPGRTATVSTARRHDGTGDTAVDGSACHPMHARHDPESPRRGVPTPWRRPSTWTGSHSGDLQSRQEWPAQPPFRLQKINNASWGRSRFCQQIHHVGPLLIFRGGTRRTSSACKPLPVRQHLVTK